MLATTLARLESLVFVFGAMIFAWIYTPRFVVWLFSRDRVWRREE